MPAPGVLANDLPNVGLSAELVAGPRHGSVTLGSDGAFVYKPAKGFVGSDSFTYRAKVGSLRTAPILVTIAVH